MAVTSDMFTWDNGLGIGELSTAEGNNGFGEKGIIQLFVKSEDSGKIMEFWGSSPLIENGEVVSYTYFPKDYKLKKQGVKIVLFND